MLVDATEFSRANRRAPVIDGVSIQYGRFPANSQARYIALWIIDTRRHPVDTIDMMKCSDSKQPRSVGVFLEVGRAALRKVVSGVMAFAHQRGNWNVCLPESHSSRSLESMLVGRWDGVIVGFDDPHGPDLLRLSVPLVGVGGGYGWFRPDMSIPYVGPDNTAVAQLAADHLLERGFVHFAYCGYSPTPVNGCSKKREQAFHEAILRTGHSCAVHNAPDTASDTWERLCDELAQWLTSLPHPLGLIWDARSTTKSNAFA